MFARNLILCKPATLISDNARKKHRAVVLTTGSNCLSEKTGEHLLQFQNIQKIENERIYCHEGRICSFKTHSHRWC